MALEDLSEAHWPPPWDRALVDAVMACLETVGRTPPPPDLPTERQGQFDLSGWPELQRDPEPFLRLSVCSERWLLEVMEPMSEAATRAPLAGDALLHGDVRGDNLCARDGVVSLVDWNLACVGNPRFDVAAWLPSLHAEGGPAPEEILTGEDAAPFAALLAGFFAARAGRPPIPEAPHVRPLQLAQARTALPWAARALGLPPLA
jgi:Ser/Thr protein kinase RdoA (MazF antagonist)